MTNSDFFILAATLIPVWLLALALQGDSISVLTTDMVKRAAQRGAVEKMTPGALSRNLAVLALLCIFVVVIGLSLIAEGFALWGVRFPNPHSSGAADFVLAVTIALTVCVVLASLNRVLIGVEKAVDKGRSQAALELESTSFE